MSEIIYIAGARLSFPKLVEAQTQAQFPNSPKKFSADLILTPGDACFERFMAEAGREANAKWKDQTAAVMQMIQNDRRLRCYGSGNEKLDKKTMKPWAGYENMVYLTTSADEAHPPKIIRADGSYIDDSAVLERQTAARKMYGGCYVDAAVRPWIQDNQFGRAIRCQLIAVQFVRDGEAFGEAQPNVDGMFKAVQLSPQESGQQLPQSQVPSWMPRV